MDAEKEIPMNWFDIGFGLKVFTNEITEYLYAVNAEEKVLVESFVEGIANNLYLQTARKAIWRQLISGLTKIFDRAQTMGNRNCSLAALKKECLEGSISPMFPEGEQDALIKEIDVLNEEYQALIPSYVRNKKIAHQDLNEIYRLDVPEISLPRTNALVHKTATLIDDILTKVIGEPIVIGNASETEYYEALKEIVSAFE